MRCFIAIDIDKRLRKQIAHLQRELCDKAGPIKSGVKWVDPAIIHLTLKFLGEVRDRQINQVCGIVEELAASHESFSLNIRKLGAFGSVARVLWVGTDENETLSALQKDLAERLCVVGFAGDKKQFSGHLTLCRIKNSSAGRTLGKLIKDYDTLDLGALEVNSVCIYKSELTKAGPEYTLISKSSLQ